MNKESYTFVSKPNSSLSSESRVMLFILLSIIPILVAIGFTIMGLWVVFPFVGLELLGLAGAFYFFNSHSDDYESIVIENDQVVIQKHTRRQTKQFVLNAIWAKVIVNHAPNGNLHLYLRSHGKSIEIGSYMDNERRSVLAKQLKEKLSAGSMLQPIG
jgi:uncharacterized membrane protein